MNVICRDRGVPSHAMKDDARKCHPPEDAPLRRATRRRGMPRLGLSTSEELHRFEETTEPCKIGSNFRVDRRANVTEKGVHLLCHIHIAFANIGGTPSVCLPVTLLLVLHQGGLFLWFCQGLSLSRRWISPDLSATFLEKPRYPHLFIELSRPASRNKVFCKQEKLEMGGPCPVPIVGIRPNVLDNFQSFEILQHLTSTNCFSSNWWHVQIVQKTLKSFNDLIHFVSEHRWNVWKLRTAVHAVKSNDYCD